jgi:hypothetical protein
MHQGAETTLQFLDQSLVPYKWHEGAEATAGPIDQRSSGANDSYLRVRVEKFDFPGEPFEQRDIVRVLPCDILSMSETQGMIEGGCDSLIGLFEKEDPAIRIASKDLARSIRRSIIHDDEFKVIETLAQNTFDAGP